VHPLHTERVEAGHRSHHVDEGVEVAHLVEVHRVDRNPVHARLRLGQPPEHGARPHLHAIRQGRTLDRLEHVAQGTEAPRRIRAHREMRAVEPTSLDRLGLQAPAVNLEARQGRLDLADLATRVDQGSEDHVPACSRRTVEVRDPH
jgi:hypothetical protein